jgi:hypothetical protein
MPECHEHGVPENPWEPSFVVYNLCGSDFYRAVQNFNWLSFVRNISYINISDLTDAIPSKYSIRLSLYFSRKVLSPVKNLQSLA